jgi:hypothetical protein
MILYKHIIIMSEDTDAQILADQIQYSADNSRVYYQQEQTNTLYVINQVLFYLYYTVVFFFMIKYYQYYLVGNSSRLRNGSLFIFLLAYPFIIYPLQYVIFSMYVAIYDRIYTNIYLTSDW